MIQLRENLEVDQPSFEPGQIIRHLRYEYRGVIVERDERCKASNHWYESNKSQPARNQPWYHVLVDQAKHTTYVAEENLSQDPSGEPIDHDLLEMFFTRYENGRYIRNQQPWQLP